MFQLIAVIALAYVFATVLCRVFLGRSLGQLVTRAIMGETTPETPTEQLARRRREAAARLAAVAGQVRDATAAVDELARREAEVDEARERLRVAEQSRVERSLEKGPAT